MVPQHQLAVAPLGSLSLDQGRERELPLSKELAAGHLPDLAAAVDAQLELVEALFEFLREVERRLGQAV